WRLWRWRTALWVAGAYLVIQVIAGRGVKPPGFVTTPIRNSRGYTLLDEGRTQDALREFEQNVKAAPGEANSYDSLAEAFLAMGDTDNAIKNYERALAIDRSFSP